MSTLLKNQSNLFAIVLVLVLAISSGWYLLIYGKYKNTNEELSFQLKSQLSKSNKATDILSEENKARNVYDIINHVTESCNGTTLLLGELNEVNDVNISSKEAQLRLEGIQENIAAVMRLLDQICFLFPRKSQENS